MKKWKIGIAGILVVLALLVTATGCGKDTSDDSSGAIDATTAASESEDPNDSSLNEESESVPNQNAETIQGVWNTSWDMSELFYLTAMMSLEDEALGDFVQIEGLDLPIQFTFQEDGTYTVIADEEAFMASLNGKTEELREGFTGYFEHTIEKEALDTTVEELLAASGFDSVDDYLDELIGGFDGISDAFTSSGNWKLRDEKLYMTKTAEENEVDPYYTYTLTANELQLLELHAEEEEDGMEGLFGDLLGNLFPMILVRAE